MSDHVDATNGIGTRQVERCGRERFRGTVVDHDDVCIAGLGIGSNGGQQPPELSGSVPDWDDDVQN